MPLSEWAASGARGRTLLAGALVLVTVAGAAALAPRIAALAADADLVWPGDPVVRSHRQITAEFGMRNPVVWVVESAAGTVWTTETLTRIRDLTRAVFTIPGVIAADVIGLASPNLRDLRVDEDGMEPIYLMGEVPATAPAVDVLRRRVEGDPNFNGTIVSEDGRAALVVANFRDDADPDGVGRAAIALRDLYRDGNTRVYVTGGPVMRVLAPEAFRPVAVWAALVIVAGLIAVGLVVGAGTGVRALLAAVLASVWTVCAVVLIGVGVLPWTVYALVPVALLAAVLAGTGVLRRDSVFGVTVVAGMALGCAVVALLTGQPVAAYGVAAAAGAVSALGAGAVMSRGGDPPRAAGGAPRWWRLVAAVVVVVSLVGLGRVRASFGMLGYGMQYVPAPATDDLRALVRLFPPPTALAVRVRGAAGFVQSPAVLHAFDAVGDAVRADPSVVRAMSIADIIKMVHRAFNGNRDEFLQIPDDRGLITRYLVLAYSPNFRQFVDRAFEHAAIWVYLRDDRPADLARVMGRLQAQLAAQPIPDAEIDPVGGDGAVLLVMANSAWQLAIGGLVLLLAIGIATGIARGWRGAGWTVTGGLAAAVLSLGTAGWLGLSLDLVTVPLIVGGAVGAGVCSAIGIALPSPRLGRVAAALAVPAVLACVAPYAAVHVLGVLALAPAAGLGLAALAPVSR